MSHVSNRLLSRIGHMDTQPGHEVHWLKIEDLYRTRFYGHKFFLSCLASESWASHAALACEGA